MDPVNSVSKQAASRPRKLWVFSTAVALVLLCCGWLVWYEIKANRSLAHLTLPSTENMRPLFTQFYPANETFKLELKNLRALKVLTSKNEILIHQSIAEVSLELNVPRSILWCLLFQESRLNHLVGIAETETAHGLGQFGYFSFYELNNQTNQFQPDTLEHMVRLMGKDIRPVEPRKSDIYHGSSYYFIPTAVTASAIYLRNRYGHLKNILDKQELSFDPELLWLFSTMAYNKGTRSVLSFWGSIRNRWGEDVLKKLLRDHTTFEQLVQQHKVLRKSLDRIWPSYQAKKYANELAIHIENINACAVDPLAYQPMETKENWNDSPFGEKES